MYRPAFHCIKRSVRQSSATVSINPLIRQSINQSINQSTRSFARIANGARRIEEDEDENEDEEYDEDAELEAEAENDELIDIDETIEQDEVPFGDQPIEDDSSEHKSATEEYQAALKEYRYNLKKRPNRKPFNPLPGVVEFDDNHDLPSFTQMDPDVFEELDDDDKAKIRAHQGLLRLRRNEQKLQRLLSIEKPSKRDLLLLLNELNAVQGKERPLYEKYIGPRVSLDQLEDDMEYLWSWGALEHTNEPIDFDDTVGEALLAKSMASSAADGEEGEDAESDAPREIAASSRSGEENEDEDVDEDGNAKSTDRPSFTSTGLADDEQAWVARRADQIRYLNRMSSAEQELKGELAVQHEEIARLQDLLAKARFAVTLNVDRAVEGEESTGAATADAGEGASIEALLALRRASQLKEERDADETEEMKADHLEMYAEDYEEDDFTQKSDFEPTESELNPELATVSNARSNAEEVEMNEQLIAKLKQQLREILKQDQEGFGTAPAKQAAKTPKVGAAKPGYRLSKAGRAKVYALNKTFQDLDEKSAQWRVKQEMVAQARSMFKAAGVELTKEDIDQIMADDEEGVDEFTREGELDQREDFADLNTAVINAEQRIAKQKAWLKTLAGKVGENEVRSMIKQGELPIDTFKGLALELTDLAQQRVQNESVEAEFYEQMVDDQLARFDEIMAEELAVEPEAIKKALEGGDIEVEEELIKEADRMRNLPAVLRPENDPINQFYGHGAVDMMLNEDLLELSRVAKERGDELGARKYELMHERRERFYAGRAEDVEAEPVEAKVEENNDKPEFLEENRDEDLDEEDEGNARKAKKVAAMEAVYARRAAEAAKPQQELDDAIVNSAFAPKWGEMTQEEIDVTLQLIKRGDANNFDFADPDLPTSNPFTLSTEEGLPLLINEMGQVVEDVLPYEPVDPTVIARDFSKMSPEEQKAAEEKIDEELFDDNRGFDEFVLAQLPYSLQNKFAKQWKKMNEEQRANAISQGRINREKFQHWLDLMEDVRSSSGVEVDALEQYHIDEPDPKIYNALEGAFWHVGRWQIDERTPEQREAGLKKKIVKRHAPETPDTQVLLDRIEADMFGVAEGDETARIEKDGEEDGDDLIEEVDVAEDMQLGEGEGSQAFDEYSPFEDDPDIDDKQFDALNAADVDDLRDTLGTGATRESEIDVTGESDRKMPEHRSNPEENYRIQAMEDAKAKRQATFTDFDPVPTGDQRAFDDYYAQFDEEDYQLAQKVQPLNINEYAEPMDEEVIYSDYTGDFEKGQHVLSAQTREALWQLHLSDPATWTVSALAMKFKMSWAHVNGILHMQAAIDRMKAHGVMDEMDENNQEEAELRGDAIDQMKEDLKDIKLRDYLNARGYDGDLMDILEEDEADGRTIEEAMLHLTPRLRRARSPEVRYVTENDMEAVIQQERDVEQRFLSAQARKAHRESDFHRQNGPIGATTAPKFTRKADPESDYQHPVVLDALSLTAPVNSHLCLTDITEKRAGRFGMVVRDVTGWLRQPTPLEFAAMRRKELQAKSKFVYTDIPHQELKTPA